MKRSEQLFSIINDIDDDIIDEAKIKEEAPVLMKPEPRSPIKGIIALAACIAVLAVGVFALVNFKLNNGGIDPAPIQNGSDSSVSDSVSSEYNISDTDSSDNSFDNSSSSTSDTSGSSENEKIEALIHEYYGKGNGYPQVACDVPEGMYVCFEEDKDIHIPIPSDGPGFTRAYDISYLKGHNFLVIAYDAGKPNSISFLRTEDKGVSWQSSELDAEYPWGFYSLAFLNSHDGIFLLQDRDVVTNQSRGDNIIYTTESYGETWKQAGYLSGDYSIINGIKVAEDHYWITGQKDTAGETTKGKSDEVLIQSSGKDYTLSEITELCKDAYRGVTRKQIKSIKVYVKAEKNELKAYYVVNDSVSGSVDL